LPTYCYSIFSQVYKKAFSNSLATLLTLVIEQPILQLTTRFEVKMVKINDQKTEIQQITKLLSSRKSMKLLAEMLAGNIFDIRPQLDFTSELGFTYPNAEKALEVKSKEIVPILESLVNEGMLEKKFFDRLLRCPQCHSINLRPILHCPKCDAGNVVRGRIMEHLVCSYIGLEDEFITDGNFMCPKCHQVLKAVDSDYRSLGLLYQCRDCMEVIGMPHIRWNCLKCSTLSTEDKITKTDIYRYWLNEAKRSLLEFEIKPKPQLINFLKQRGYQVVENATVKGRSEADHKIDIMATKDDGIITYTIAIGIRVAGEKIELGEIFDFDDKAYDIGIHDKILVIVPELGREAEKFASQQRIKVLEVRDLDTVLAGSTTEPTRKKAKEPFEFKSKSQLIKYLQQYGYDIKEKTKVKGKSGASHTIDILATKDDGIITHHIAIGIEEAKEPISLDSVFDFDDKAYDIGIMDKAFIAAPGLTQEAKQFARRQRIKVFEVNEIEPKT